MSRCRRCGGQIVRDVDELTCFSCGTLFTPVRATDALEEPAPTRDRDRFERTGSKWSAGELRYLSENKDRMTAKEMGAVLGRSERAIHTLLWKRGEGKVAVRRMKQSVQPRKSSPPRRKRWAPAELEALEDFAAPGATRSLAARYGCTPLALRLRLHRLGIRLREADGMWSISEVAREYRTTRHRVRRLIQLGHLAAERVAGTSLVRIDPADAERCASMLRARSRFAPKPAAAPRRSQSRRAS